MGYLMDIAEATPARRISLAVLIAFISFGLPACLIGFCMRVAFSTPSTRFPDNWPNPPGRPGSTLLATEPCRALTIETWRTFGMGCCDGNGIVLKCLTFGHGKSPIVRSLGDYSISPTKNLMVAYGDEGSRVAINLQSGAILGSWKVENDQDFREGAWSADGKSFVFLASRAGNVGLELIEFVDFTRPPARRPLGPTVAGFFRREFPACSWSPTSSRIACFVYPKEAGNYEVFDLLELDFAEPTSWIRMERITAEKGTPRIEWNQDTASIAFAK